MGTNNLGVFIDFPNTSSAQVVTLPPKTLEVLTPCHDIATLQNRNRREPTTNTIPCISIRVQIISVLSGTVGCAPSMSSRPRKHSRPLSISLALYLRDFKRNFKETKGNSSVRGGAQALPMQDSELGHCASLVVPVWFQQHGTFKPTMTSRA